MSTICIVGGGLSGLAAADFLVDKGYKVTIFEKEDFLGGVASNLYLEDGRIIPKAYHQIVGTDEPLIDTLKSKNIYHLVKWGKIKIRFSINNLILDLSNPLELIKCNLISFFSKIAFIKFGIKCLLKKDWTDFENLSVKELILQFANKEVYEKIFKPLIDIKFGLNPEQLSASWLGLRLHKREAKTQFGYMENASWTEKLIKAYVENIEAKKGIIHTCAKVERLNITNEVVTSLVVNGDTISFDIFLFTIDISAIHKIIDSFANREVEYISSYSLIAGVDTVTFDDYWTIAHTPRRSFGGCFVLSNLNTTLLTGQDKSVINCFVNVPYNKFDLNDEEFAHLCKVDLENMLGKDINFNWFKVTKINATSPIFLKGYKNYESRYNKNLYFAGIYKTFPSLSSTGTAIEDGKKVAKLIHEDIIK